MQDSNLRPID